MALELGDCLWYLGALATAYGLDLDAIAEQNRAKLEARYPAGFEVGGGRTGTESRRQEP
jgi:NTP pyrophosphatase (non-canonical NTP hydrolase)